MSKQRSTAEQKNAVAADRMRLDLWLWAARFFRTRSLAKAAIEGGKVHCNGERCKSSKIITLGTTLNIRQGFDDKEVVVQGLSDKRRGAPEAALLYEESAESIARRSEQAAQRRAQNAAMEVHSGRPSKQDRRRIERFKREHLEP